MVSFAQTVPDYLASLPTSLRTTLNGVSCRTRADTADDVGVGGGESEVSAATPLTDDTCRTKEPRLVSLAAATRTAELLHSAPRTLQFLEPVPTPYRGDSSPLDTYADTDGNEYWFCAETGALIQMGPTADYRPPTHPTRSSGKLAVKELRERATELITRLRPDWPTRRSSLHPLEDNRRREIYYFRWDDFSSPVSESELPPFIQVALRADGSLASFTDTLRA